MVIFACLKDQLYFLYSYWILYSSSLWIPVKATYACEIFVGGSTEKHGWTK